MENPLTDLETLRTDLNGHITEIGGKPASISEIQGQYIGLIKFSSVGAKIAKLVYENSKLTKNLNGKIPEKAYMTDLLQAIINIGYPVKAVLTSDPWVEIDTSEDLHSTVTTKRLKMIDAELEKIALNQENSS